MKNTFVPAILSCVKLEMHIIFARRCKRWKFRIVNCAVLEVEVALAGINGGTENS